MLEPTAPFRPSVVALAASILLLTACEPRDGAVPKEATPAPAPTPAPALPTQPAALSRADLLQAVDAAASAYAAGEPAAGDALAGRRILIRQPFGCGGPKPAPAADAEGDGLARWSWGRDQKTLELALAPGAWTESPLIAGGSETWEAVEGVWLTRPWLRTETCPGGGTDPLASGPEAPSPQTVGLAAVFEADGSRLGRRNGRAYAFTIRGDGDQPPPAPAAGFHLVLEGRLTAFADGRAIRCRAASRDQRPVCIAAAQIDRVAFEDASGAVLSEWRGG